MKHRRILHRSESGGIPHSGPQTSSLGPSSGASASIASISSEHHVACISSLQRSKSATISSSLPHLITRSMSRKHSSNPLSLISHIPPVFNPQSISVRTASCTPTTVRTDLTYSSISTWHSFLYCTHAYHLFAVCLLLVTVPLLYLIIFLYLLYLHSSVNPLPIQYIY